MNLMFFGASAFNQDLSAWDVSAVTDMHGMFRGAIYFNQALSKWPSKRRTAQVPCYPPLRSRSQPEEQRGGRSAEPESVRRAASVCQHS